MSINEAWQLGWDWAANNYYIDGMDLKNVDGGILGQWLSTLGIEGNYAAEGVTAFLNS